MADALAERWRFLPKDQAINGPTHGFCQVYSNRWWVVHPEKGLAFFWSKGVKGLGSPQCNSNESISRRLGTTIEGATLEFIPRVFVPINLGDWT